jgi:hypothetical protein
VAAVAVVVPSSEGAKIEEGFLKFNPNEDPEGMEEVEEQQVVDNERCYMLSFIKKNRKVVELVRDERQIRNNFLSKLAYNNVWINP